MQNPSDPEATYDGHKGKGYQVQLAETCHPDNPVQLITCAIAQAAADEDGDALPEVVAQTRRCRYEAHRIARRHSSTAAMQMNSFVRQRALNW